MEQKNGGRGAAAVMEGNNKCTEETKTRQTNKKKKEGPGRRSIVNVFQLFRVDPLVNIEPSWATRLPSFDISR